MEAAAPIADAEAATPTFGTRVGGALGRGIVSVVWLFILFCVSKTLGLEIWKFIAVFTVLDAICNGWRDAGKRGS